MVDLVRTESLRVTSHHARSRHRSPPCRRPCEGYYCGAPGALFVHDQVEGGAGRSDSSVAHKSLLDVLDYLGRSSPSFSSLSHSPQVVK